MLESVGQMPVPVVDFERFRRILVLGGARSGKSRLAETLALQCGEEKGGDTTLHYIATAESFDDEMAARIEAHKARRGSAWVTHDAPRELPQALAALNAPGAIVLVDCLTLWLTNAMLAEADWEAEAAALEAEIRRFAGVLILVSNETGMGIVPTPRLGRQFRDAQGVLNQRVGEQADAVLFTFAGHAHVLKPPAKSPFWH